MERELTDDPASTTVDLTGLPDSVVEGIRQLVESLRVGMTDRTHPQAKPPRPPLRGRFAHQVPDMRDRIVAATAVAHNLPIVSADSQIRNSITLGSIVPVLW